MIRWLFALAALPACDVIFRVDHLGDALADAVRPDDGASDTSTECLVGSYGVAGRGLVSVCVTASVELALSGVIDTRDACTHMEVNGTMVCLLSGTSITTTDAVTFTGNVPVLLAATDRITIGHPIAYTPDLSVDTSCAAVPTQPLSGDGGAGGSYSTSGGSGGAYQADASATASAPGVLHLGGGCMGQGGGGVAGVGGTGGIGGGAIYITARTSITLAMTGSIDASGLGGNGGMQNTPGGGGGGGGAGGLIALDTPTLDVAAGAQVFANGGGGGGGGHGGVQGQGPSGSRSMGPHAPGTGGGPTIAGSGGDGATATVAAQVGMAASAAGAGGGGGGLGFIAVFTTGSAPSPLGFSPTALIDP